MKTGSYRDTWAEISLGNIRHNVNMLKSQLRESCRLMAVVKADGYGHGSVEVAKAAVDAGARELGVAFLDEAIHLRKAGMEMPILILGHTAVQAVEEAVRNDVGITFFSEDVLDEIIACSKKLGRQARIHLKIDTGMSRLGVFSLDEAIALAEKAIACGTVELEGVFTHFADADNEDVSYTWTQYRKFTAMIAELEKRNIRIPVKHCCNSAATLNFPEMHLDMVRIGINLYGLLSTPQRNRDRYPFRQAMTLKTRIVALKRVREGSAVSYGRTFRTKADSLIATLPVGYADGYSRLLSNNGNVLVRGIMVPIVGRICMDQLMIDITSIPDVQVGEDVTLFGYSEGQTIAVDEIALKMNSINYEVVCAVGKRVPRIYFAGTTTHTKELVHQRSVKA
jgi:alanine racemase